MNYSNDNRYAREFYKAKSTAGRFCESEIDIILYHEE